MTEQSICLAIVGLTVLGIVAIVFGLVPKIRFGKDGAEANFSARPSPGVAKTKQNGASPNTSNQPSRRRKQ